VQKLFKLRDGEKVIAAYSLDPRSIGNIAAKTEGDVPPVHALAVTGDGYSLRFSFEPFVEASTRAGRRYARPAVGVDVVGVARLTGEETIIAATQDARAILCPADEVNFLSGPGKGVILIKLTSDDDRVIGFVASEQTISTAKYEVTGRGG
jgi:DNA gyrase subunit A